MIMQAFSTVTALIITYAPDPAVLDACISSLRAQNPPPRILVADNLCPNDPSHKTALSFRSDDVTVIPFNRNYGFGGAINRAFREIKTPYVVISNFDIVYDPHWIETALARLESGGPETVGVACKTLFYPPEADKDWPGRGPSDPSPQIGRGTGAVIDNTGTLVNGLMLAYNRGVGQIDIGQYDRSDRPMGACFAAFLARRDAFKPVSQGGVGLLDAGYFMYYEDIDWCYRANLLGFRITYEPDAIAWHHHSLTTRGKSLFFKYHLIQRNLYRTIIKNMRLRTAIKLGLMHARLHIRRARIEREFGPVTARILLETTLWKPSGLIKRIPIQSHRKISDTDIVNLSIGEEGHLDDITLRPQADWRNPLRRWKGSQGFSPTIPRAACCRPFASLPPEDLDPSLPPKPANWPRKNCPALVKLIDMIISKS